MVFVLILVLISLLSSCASIPEKVCVNRDNYAQGHQALIDYQYRSAIDKLEAVRSCDINGQYAVQAHIELIFAYMQNYQPETAKKLADRFIKFYPKHEHLDYVLYLKGLYYFYYQQSSIIYYFVDDLSDRNITIIRQSYQNLVELLQRFPQSIYAFDARLRVVFLKKLLAKYEIHIAYYYMQRGAYIAAVKRADYVVNKYKRTSSVMDALEIKFQAYKAMHMQTLASKTKQVLQLNK